MAITERQTTTRYTMRANGNEQAHPFDMQVANQGVEGSDITAYIPPFGGVFEEVPNTIIQSGAIPSPQIIAQKGEHVVMQGHADIGLEVGEVLVDFNFQAWSPSLFVFVPDKEFVVQIQTDDAFKAIGEIITRKLSYSTNGFVFKALQRGISYGVRNYLSYTISLYCVVPSQHDWFGMHHCNVRIMTLPRKPLAPTRQRRSSRGSNATHSTSRLMTIQEYELGLLESPSPSPSEGSLPPLGEVYPWEWVP